MLARVRESLAADAPAGDTDGRLLEVPVRYGGDAGPDLPLVAQATGLAPDEVVRLHAGALYRVAMLGFKPGFPYLLGLPVELRLPRRSSEWRPLVGGATPRPALHPQFGAYSR